MKKNLMTVMAAILMATMSVESVDAAIPGEPMNLMERVELVEQEAERELEESEARSMMGIVEEQEPVVSVDEYDYSAPVQTVSRSAQNSDPDSLSITERNLGQWIITRRYEVSHNNGDAEVERTEKVRYDVSRHGFSAHFPIYYMGFASLNDGAFSFSSAEPALNEAKSWEWGIYFPMESYALGNRVGITTAFGFGRTMYKFEDAKCFMRDANRDTQLWQPVDRNNAPYDEAWSRYWSFRLPIQVELQTSSDGIFFSVGPEIEYRFAPCSKGRMDGDRKKSVVTKDLDIHPLNVNLMAQLGYDDVTLVARASLRELFTHSTYATSVWPVSIGIGLAF